MVYDTNITQGIMTLLWHRAMRTVMAQCRTIGSSCQWRSVPWCVPGTVAIT